MATHTHTRSFDRGTGALSYPVAEVVQSEAIVGPDLSIPNGATNQLLAGGQIDLSQLTSLFIVADGGALLLESNDDAAPDDALSLVDGVPVQWFSDSPDACPITADVADWRVTNASGAAVLLTIIAGHGDATP